MPSYCSPNHQEIYDKTQTCYTKAQLILIAKQYNKYAKKKIKLNTSKKELLKDLHNRLQTHEAKWHQHHFMNNVNEEEKDSLIESFKPEKPKEWNVNERQWLNTYDILEVMEQYEDKYPSFKFLGVFPIDFEHKVNGKHCVSPVMCNFDLKSLLKRKITQCGAVLNLDYHYQSGSHWVCLYIGLVPHNPNFGCYYIDSGASKAPSEVVTFFKKIKSQIVDHYSKEDSDKFKFRENKKQFQFKNTECGMFSMYFLIQFLKQRSFKTIINSKINDDGAFKLRDEYYLTS
jgi:hypothetical protein|uniref:Ubiquitin-like protease family profile domain-containing protein n=1 Tax=viral metagenome TaxID=1070528 RepID=A0A6C0CSP4_9ZZZZ